ncbi:MAG: helix-turn-helix domain-containing protein [Clostridia bacterium]|nr:helix-turn-helix domain-containing protein [Clostridia bacterium]
MVTGRRIKERRIALGLSADRLAEMIGKNRATIYRYESDEIENFPLPIIDPLADALQTSPAYLMGWTDDPSPMVYETTPEDEPDPERERIATLFLSLTEENQKRLLDYAELLLKAQQAERDSRA